MSQSPQHNALEWDQMDRLHKSLRVSGMSVQQLASALGIHRNTVGNWLSGRVPVDRRTMLAWAFATGVPVDWLETGTGTEPTPPDDGQRAESDELAALTEAKRARHGMNRSDTANPHRYLGATGQYTTEYIPDAA